MDRKGFIKTCGLACLGGAALALVLESCGSAKRVLGSVQGTNLVVPVSNFWIKGEKENGFLQSIVVRNDQLKYPIWVVRHSENNYTAHWMQCTHKGVELTSYGDRLLCSAHGSEFTSLGVVKQGPATTPLRQFGVQLEQEQIKISLQAI